MNNHYDIIIVGGGLAGLTLACALPAQLNIAIIEEKPPSMQWQSGEYDIRVSAINRASQHIFASIDAWENMQAMRIAPYRAMQVWDVAGRGEIDFDSLAIGEPDLGHIVENSVMQIALLQQIQQRDNIHIIAPAAPAKLVQTESEIILRLDDERQLSAKLLVGADGAHSWVREHAAFELRSQPYQHHALVATVQTELSHRQTARQRFLADGGILAFLPLADPHSCSIVWSTSPEMAQQLQQKNAGEFNETLRGALGGCLGRIEKTSKVLVFPLLMRHVKQYVKPRLALIGDAAHTIHPLAGQGINLGLLDAACLAEVVARAAKKSRDIGYIDTLRRYERWRKGHNAMMIATMEGFKRLFAAQASSVVSVRAAGLNAVNKSNLIKNIFIRRAMGLSGDLPTIGRTMF